MSFLARFGQFLGINRGPDAPVHPETLTEANPKLGRGWNLKKNVSRLLIVTFRGASSSSSCRLRRWASWSCYECQRSNNEGFYSERGFTNALFWGFDCNTSCVGRSDKTINFDPSHANWFAATDPDLDEYSNQARQKYPLRNSNDPGGSEKADTNPRKGRSWSSNSLNPHLTLPTTSPTVDLKC